MKKPVLTSFVVLITLVAVVAGGWTAFWFWSANKAETLLDQTIVHQSAEGREIACASRSRGGFPFRLEFDCEQPTIVLDRGKSPRHLTMQRLNAVTQVWDPGHIIVYGYGPLVLRLGDRDAPEMARMTWTGARASAKLGIDGFNSASFALDGFTLVQDVEIMRAQSVVLHHRPSGPTGRDLDIVGKLTGLEIALAPLQGSPFDVEAQFRLKQFLRLPYMPAMMNLRDWQQAGGALDLVLLRVDQGESTARASGNLSLTREGKPEGTLEIRSAALDQFVRKLGLPNGVLTGISAANLFAKPVDIDGRRGALHQVRFTNGNAAIGPVSIPVPGLF